MRTAVSRAAQALSVPWSFEVVRGALLDSVLNAMREPDLAVFGWTGPFAMAPGARPTSAAASATVRPPFAGMAAVSRPIVTLYDDTAAAERALGTAQALALAHHAALVVLLVAPDDQAAAQLRSRAAAQLQGGALPARFQTLHARDAVSIRSAVERNHGAVLLWHGTRQHGRS